MATRPPSSSGGSWQVARELLERGDPAFVDELRRIHDAENLGKFAAEWYNDPRPAARRFLLEYLDRPLSAPRHEPLVKRLFKLAEAAGDDEVMGRFLVALDRSVRRQLRKTYRWDPVTRQYAEGQRAMVPSGNSLPRNDHIEWDDPNLYLRRQLPNMRLYSVPTRNYLRRRAWRYFRKIGKTDTPRYLAAMRRVLPLYTEQDVADGLALLDNWGLVHILFHHSPALIPNPAGWTLAQGHALKDVEAAPYFPEAWRADARPLLELLDAAQSRAVRQWAIQMLRREHPDALPNVPVEKLIEWLGHRSPEMVSLAVELLKAGGKLESVRPERLLRLLRGAPAETLELLCELAAGALKPEQVTIAQAVELARQRPVALAKLGFDLLQRKAPQTREECEALLQLAETECNQLRGEMVRWSCGVLSAAADFDSLWVLEYLDNRFDEVRAAGWDWLQTEPRCRDNVLIWQRLLESPYDDVRLKMIVYLEELDAKRGGVAVPDGPFDPEAVRLLWATVLLNVQRGSKHKPAVVKQLQQHLDRHPDQAGTLLPLLAVALRSLRGPEFRAGMVSMVQFLRRHPEAEEVVRRAVPELRMAPEALVS
ncbi:MAG TPA: hypothetical protein VIL46_06040 [Gemmataceae bacterium]